MKTIKSILLIFVLGCSTMLMATEYTLHQTSSATYKSIGSDGASAVGVVGGSRRSSAAVSAPGAAISVSMPTVSFHSTSAMKPMVSTLPNAVERIVLGNDGQSIGGEHSLGGRRNAADNGDTPPTDDPPGPNETPVGDAVLPLLLLAAGYVLWLRRRKIVEIFHRG